MKNITILKLIRLLSLNCLFILVNVFTLFAQKNVSFVNAELKQQAFYTSLPKVYYIALLPIHGCFACEAALNNQVKNIVSQKDKIIIIYPSARKIVQEKIKKENKLDLSKAIYVFDDKLYQKLYDATAPKGYTLKLLK